MCRGGKAVSLLSHRQTHRQGRNLNLLRPRVLGDGCSGRCARLLYQHSGYPACPEYSGSSFDRRHRLQCQWKHRQRIPDIVTHWQVLNAYRRCRIFRVNGFGGYNGKRRRLSAGGGSVFRKRGIIPSDRVLRRRGLNEDHKLLRVL